jgi:DNA invertase Pin-like site-specific DNA recombinase
MTLALPPAGRVSAASTNSPSTVHVAPRPMPRATSATAASPAKITPTHLARRAYVYVRQSSAKQVRENLESQALQYQLAERAVALGWPREQVETIDADQGQSGADAAGRRGFQYLVAEVSLGRAGIVLALEVSRLARNGKDWYQLLERCALFDTLLADAEGTYDLRQYNDRLLLGLKGTVSEAELHLIRQRMDAGRLAKARRGELVQHLPTGYVRDALGRAVLDPDTAVQDAIRRVFARFEALGTAERVVRDFRHHALLLPRHQTAGEFAGQTLWKPATAAAVIEILHNPAYAGAFVYGRRPADPRKRLQGKTSWYPRLPVEAWQVLIRDAHPAYVTWAAWEANQARLRANAARYDAAHAPGVPREGRALLVGLVRCGRCGGGMDVSYRPQHRYHCDGLTRHYGGERCPSVPGAPIDTAVRDAVFAALRPAELDVLDRLLAERAAAAQAADHAWQQRVGRARHEARLAERRYRAVDPEQRLVAAHLEREWNGALVALAEAEAADATHRAEAERERQLPWTATLRDQLRHLGEALPELWTDLTNAQRTQVLRAVVAHVVVSRPRPQAVRVRIVWVTGHYTDREIRPRVRHFREIDHYPALLERIRAWNTADDAPLSDEAIAERLRAENVRPPRGSHFDAGMVARLRRGLGLYRPLHRVRTAHAVGDALTAGGLAARLGVDYQRIYRLVTRGLLPVTRHAATGVYLVPNTPAVFTQARRLLKLAPSEPQATSPAGV